MHVRLANPLVLLIACTATACSSLVNTDDYTFVPEGQDGGDGHGEHDGGAVADASRPNKPGACADRDDDGVCDRDDACAGSDDELDADGDGVPDGCDACSGHDDTKDEDGDQVPDGCDCDQSASDCNTDATCADGSEGVDCTCNPGFGGDGKTACTAGDCNPPDAPEHGAVDVPSTHPGDVATFSCESGYTLSGADTLTCEQGGSWSGDAPTCDPVDCGGLGKPSHGSVDLPDGTLYPGAATYGCDAGYMLDGDATRSCTQDGTWSGDEPSCLLVDCGALTAPAHGSVSTPGGKRYKAVATYGCQPGYILSTTATRSCQADGSWSNTEPTCGLLCGFNADVEDAAGNDFGNCVGDLYSGSVACLGQCSPEKATDEDFATRSCMCNSGSFDERPTITETFTKPPEFTHAYWEYKFDIANTAMCTAAEINASCFDGTGYIAFDHQATLGLQTVIVPVPAACIRPSTMIRIEQHLANCGSSCASADHYVMYYDGRMRWQVSTDAEDSSTNTFAGCSADPFGAACLGECGPANAVDEDFNTRACVCNSGSFDQHPSITETFTNPAGYTVASWTYRYAIANGAGCEAAEVIASCFNGSSFISFDTRNDVGMHTVTVPLPKACVRATTLIQVQQHLKNCGGDCMAADHYVMYYEGKVDWDNCQSGP